MLNVIATVQSFDGVPFFNKNVIELLKRQLTRKKISAKRQFRPLDIRNQKVQ